MPCARNAADTILSDGAAPAPPDTSLWTHESRDGRDRLTDI